LRYSRFLGLKEPFVYKIVEPIVDIMGDFYPEVKGNVPNLIRVIESEERRFLETIENGMDRIEEIMKSLKKKGEHIIPGKEAFTLYDTFGFPLEMTTEMAEEEGLKTDIEGFNYEMEKQRQRGKQSWKGSEAGLDAAFDEIMGIAGTTEFLGYEKESAESEIAVLYNGTKKTDLLAAGDRGLLVLKSTPFYGESGGQVGDTGVIKSGDSLFRVEDTKKHNKTIIHIGFVEMGEFRTGDRAEASIDNVNRNLIRANHTATHLLNAALHKVLGDHVKQAGSIVDPERFRFDFSHFNAMTEEEIGQIESLVNQKIWENIEVSTEVMDIKEAIGKGAVAVFDEKYEDTVRVINVPGFSMELCGGTHVSNTGKIGVFKILKESSPGAGVRRIEAVTLKGLLDRFMEHDRIISALTEKVNVPETGLVKKVDEIITKSRALEKETEKLKKSSLSSDLDSIIASGEDVNGVKIISRVFSGLDANSLREVSDAVRERVQNCLICLGSDIDGKAMILYAATSKAVEAGVDCGRLVKETAGIVGGGGGGRKDMAQAGGKSPGNLKQAIDEAVKLGRSMTEK
jgi:alanyl-tRNA synthetase